MADDATAPVPTREPVRVFISYRTNPDAQVANALQRLIEASIEPAPQVFVAGNGGIRPSNAGFRQQITEAARKAHAFVAVITNASKEREWIFFEAGAAWGQNLMYVPVLIGTRPSDLPNTIADYQALNGQVKDDMARLMNELSRLAGAQVVNRFGPRFASFKKSIEEYLKGSLLPDSVDSAEAASLNGAIQLASGGQTTQALAAFDQLEAEAQASGNMEQLCLVKIFRIQSFDKPSVWGDKYESLDKSLQNTAVYHHFAADEVKHPWEKEAHWRRCVEIGIGLAATLSELEMAKLHAQQGRRSLAAERLLKLIREQPRTRHSEAAAVMLNEIGHAATPLDKLLTLMAGHAGSQAAHYLDLAELCEPNLWWPLRLHCAHRAVDIASGAAELNELGRARATLGYCSLAFQSYSRSAELGASAALCNMAALLSDYAVPAAGLKLLADHNGGFDVANRQVPYQVRSRIEQIIQGEDEQEQVLLKLGRTQFNALLAIVSDTLHEPNAAPTVAAELPSGKLKGEWLTVSIAKGEVIAQAGMSAAPVVGFEGRMVRITHGDKVALVSVHSRACSAVAFTSFANASGLEWLVWEPLGQTPATLPAASVPTLSSSSVAS